MGHLYQQLMSHVPQVRVLLHIFGALGICSYMRMDSVRRAAAVVVFKLLHVTSLLVVFKLLAQVVQP